jgi:GNAT superfamily N-acetyltransferase
MSGADGTAATAVQLRGLQPGDLGWVVGRHGALYGSEYGFDQRFEALVARIVAEYVERLHPALENAWIAQRADVSGMTTDPRLGCVFLVQARDDTTQQPDPGVAQLRLLLVEPQARGLGLGQRLTAACEDFARQAGYRRMRLWTNRSLSAARAIYRKAGYQLLDSQAHESFGNVQVGEVWEKALTEAAPGSEPDTP